MGWSGTLTASSAQGSSITLVSDTSNVGEYTVSKFTSPKKAIYKFELFGSGGAAHLESDHDWSASVSPGGAGGHTIGYLLLEAGDVVYVGVGGMCSAAFVSKINVSKLSDAGSGVNLWFVAGGGGGGGANWGQQWNMKSSAGGAGGGTTGGQGGGGSPGTQTGGYAFGTGGGGGYSNSDDTSLWAGRGGDGYYGGTGGTGFNGGSGGSGFINTSSLIVGNKTYTNSTEIGGGAASRANGYAIVTYYAKAELPITYNNQIVMELYYNNQEVKSLYYNGTKIY